MNKKNSLILYSKNNKSTLGVDFAYRTTSSDFNGIYSVGIRLNLAGAKEE